MIIYKYLGIVIDSRLKWNENTEHDEKSKFKDVMSQEAQEVWSQCESSSDVL